MKIKWFEALQKYPSFAKFQTALDRGRLAPTTLQSYVNDILNFTQTLNLKDPENALKTIKENDDREEFFNKAIDTLRKITTDTMINKIFKALRYWLRVNGVQVDWGSVIIPTGEMIVEDRIPTKDELKRLLTIANIRDQAIILVASSSGLRLNTLLTLKVGDVDFDLPDIASIMVKRVYIINGKEYRTGRKISKKRKFFVTYITPEARKALEAYLAWRKDEGEDLTLDSPLFTTMDKPGRGRFLEKHAYARHWNTLLKRAHLDGKANGSPWTTLHFHTLKKYTDTKMIDAGVKRAYREFFLGHKGEYLEINYFRGEKERCIEEYRKAIPNLSVLEHVPDLRQRAVERIMNKIIHDEPLTDEDRLDIEKYNIRLRERARQTRQNNDCDNCENCPTFKEINEGELLSHLQQGWRITHNLQNGKVIIQKG